MGRITRAFVVLALPLAAAIVPTVSAQVTGGSEFSQAVTSGMRNKQGGESGNHNLGELLDDDEEEEEEEDEGVISFEIPGLRGTMDDPFYQDSFERTQLRPAISEDVGLGSTGPDSDDDTLTGEESDSNGGYIGSDADVAASWMGPGPEAVDVSKEAAISEVLPTQEMTLALARKICRSREFLPTLENYWISGTDEFLRGYIRENWDSQEYRDFGLRSLARKYLGSNSFQCSFEKGFFDSSTCRVTCEEAVQNVGSLKVARKVYFALSSIAGLAESFGAISDSLPKAAEREQFLVNEMPRTRKWFDSLGPEGQFLVQVQQYFGAVRSAAFAAAPWTPVAQIAENALADLGRARSNYENAVRVADMIDRGDEDPYRWDKLFDPNYEMAVSDIDFAPSGAADTVLEDPSRPTDNWHGRTVERAKQVLKDQLIFEKNIQEGDLEQARNEGYVIFQELFSPGIEAESVGPERQKLSATGDAVAKLVLTLRETLERLLAGDGISPDGSTNLSRLLKYGQYLPLGAARPISAFKSANLADKLSRSVFMRLFDLSFASQKLYISCTKDAQMRSDPQKGDQGQLALSCAKDNTGPQNLKACVDGHVCYLYRWSERKFDYLSRNRKPKDLDKWDEAPFNINPEDVITSSVKSRLWNLQRGETELPVDVQFALAGSGIESLQDASAPGLFHIPVCFSQYNWNTQTSGYNTFCDTNPNCVAKSFPCHCGPWGADTESVWRGMGVWGGKKHGFYAGDLCPKQIQKKLEDPLERYASYCRLGVRRNSPWTRVDGLLKFQGKDKYCEPILCTVEQQGAATAAALDPEIAFSCMCKVRKGGRGCSMYGNMFDELWEKAFNSGCLESKNAA